MAIYYCFPGGKYKVLTLSYDDGKIEDRRLVALCNDHGIKGTFNLNGGNLGEPSFVTKEEVKELYKGHEVACHTFSHPTLERCPKSEIVNEIMKDRKELEALVGYPVRGFSYPNGSYHNELIQMLPSLGIEYGRIVATTNQFAMPKDYYTWQSTCHHNHNLLENCHQFVEASKSQYLYLMYVWGHSYEFSIDNNWELMESFFEQVGRRDDIWYASNIEIVDYMKVVNNLIFTADSNMVMNPFAQTAFLSVNGRIVEIPGGKTVTLA